MLMICWFYCIPFAKFAWFASSAVFFVFALFMLKRGVHARRPRLRLAAFFMMFGVIIKTFLLDVRIAKNYLLCDYAGKKGWSLPLLSCSPRGLMIADFTGMALCIAASLLLFNAYRAYIPEKKVDLVPPEKVRLRFWSNAALWGVIAMICWLAAPWVGFLTVGHVPGVFLAVPWQHFALANLALLLYGFWRAENCAWTFQVGKKDSMRHLQSTWTPRDTLWMTVFLYLIALALSYVAHDVLTAHDRAVSP